MKIADLTHEELEKIVIEQAKLLLEARDALPAITIERAKLYNVSLSLADRIEAALEPWRVKE